MERFTLDSSDPTRVRLYQKLPDITANRSVFLREFVLVTRVFVTLLHDPVGDLIKDVLYLAPKMSQQQFATIIEHAKLLFPHTSWTIVCPEAELSMVLDATIMRKRVHSGIRLPRADMLISSFWTGSRDMSIQREIKDATKPLIALLRFTPLYPDIANDANSLNDYMYFAGELWFRPFDKADANTTMLLIRATDGECKYARNMYDQRMAYHNQVTRTRRYGMQKLSYDMDYVMTVLVHVYGGNSSLAEHGWDEVMHLNK